MSDTIIRPAFSSWPHYDRQLRAVVAVMTDEQLAIRPAPDRWPMWATIGHVACQRVSGLCGLAGEPGAASTPFPDALYRCPGDEYLEPSMNGTQLADALASTFAIVEHALDTWTLDTLDREMRHTFDGGEVVVTRGRVIQRAFAHDLYHTAELNEMLTANALPPVDLWT
jgi:hypothetical protein